MAYNIKKFNRGKLHFVIAVSEDNKPIRLRLTDKEMKKAMARAKKGWKKGG